MLDLGFIHALRRMVGLCRSSVRPCSSRPPCPRTSQPSQTPICSRTRPSVGSRPGRTTAERIDQRVIHVDPAAKSALLTQLLAQAHGHAADPRLHPHQAPRRSDDPPPAGCRDCSRCDPHQHVAEQPRAGAGRLQVRPRPGADRDRHCRPRDRHRRASPMSSTSTCPMSPSPMSTASVAPPVPARRAWRSLSAAP